MAEKAKIAEFNFLVPVAKATKGKDGELYVEGVASTPALDREGDVLTAKAQATMAQWANTGEVALGGEADHFRVAFDDDLGTVEKGEVLEDGGFFVRAKLDTDNPRAVALHKKLRNGSQLGLSVFGAITKAHNAGAGRMIDGVRLSRITVTKRPVNPETWLGAVAKALPALNEVDGGDEQDPVVVAKGKFREMLRLKQEQEAAEAPVKEQKDRVREISGLVTMLYDAMYASDEPRSWYESLTPEQRADAISEAIDEFKVEVMAKQGEGDEGGEQVAKLEDDEGGDQAPEQDPDTDPEPDTEVKPETEAPPVAKQNTPQSQQPQGHPGARVARSFAEAASMLLDAAEGPAEQRRGMEALVGKLAGDLDQAIPREEGDEAPVWATKLFERFDALEERLGKMEAAPASVPATSADDTDGADEGARDVAKMRKSVPNPSVRPSASVAKAATFGDIVDLFMSGGQYPAKP